MRFRMHPGMIDGQAGAMKKGPADGPLLIGSDWSEWGGSDAQARRGDGRSEAEEQQERGGETVESPFKLRERHDTHLSVGPLGRGGVSYLNDAQIGRHLSVVKISVQRSDMKLW